DYEQAIPDKPAIDQINKLYREGHTILLLTARGWVSDKEWGPLTAKQMEEWGLQYHALHMTKPAADVYIDDRAVNVAEWKLLRGD
ncbi:hypothetical protein LCGC14_2918280, partial [marine sediment metagenome]